MLALRILVGNTLSRITSCCRLSPDDVGRNNQHTMNSMSTTTSSSTMTGARIGPMTNTRTNTTTVATGSSTLLSNSSTTTSSQPMIVLYISSHHTAIAAGYDNVPHPQHILELPTLSASATSTMKVPSNLRSLHDAEAIFHYYATTIERLIHLLGGGSPLALGIGGTTVSSGSGSNSSTHQRQNRFVVLHDQGLYVNRHWKVAILRILQDVCHATYVSFTSTIHMIPFAIVTPPTATHQNEDCQCTVLSIHITPYDAQCMVYANGHHLEYTYQSCEYDSDMMSSHASMVDDVRKRQETWLFSDNNISNYTATTSPLIDAIALCIEKCPVSVRKDAIQNLFFSGTILVKGFSEQVAVLLRQFLLQPNDSARTQASTIRTEAEAEVNSSTDDVMRNEDMVQFTRVPVNRTLLRPLAAHIAIIDCFADISSYELIPWFGTNVWIAYWRYQEQDSGILAKEMNWIDVMARTGTLMNQ
jgi:hypothetical protein